MADPRQMTVSEFVNAASTNPAEETAKTIETAQKVSQCDAAYQRALLAMFKAQDRPATPSAMREAILAFQKVMHCAAEADEASTAATQDLQAKGRKCIAILEKALEEGRRGAN